MDKLRYGTIMNVASACPLLTYADYKSTIMCKLLEIVLQHLSQVPPACLMNVTPYRNFSVTPL